MRKRPVLSATGQFELFDATLPLRREDHADELPATARQLVAVIGLPATIDLVKSHFVGSEIRVPVSPERESATWHALVEVIGEEAALRLALAFGDQVIYIPFCHAALVAWKHRQIRAEIEAGTPFEEVRQRHRLTRSWLYRILSADAPSTPRDRTD